MTLSNQLMKFLLFAALIINIHCRLAIFSPELLRNKFSGQKHDMPYVVAHYGHVPFGKTLMGSLYYASPHDGCSTLDRSDMNWVQRQNENDPDNIPIVFVDRGNCTFVTKTKMAQLVGAKMVIIADNKDGEDLHSIIMADDGNGGTISIPTVMIGKSDADIIRNFIKENQNKPVTIVASFPQANDVNDVSAEFWFSSSDNSAYKFITNFEPYIEKIDQDAVTIKPHYVLWYCAECKSAGFTSAQSNCLSAGRYCAPDPDGQGPAQGSTVVLEDLRQICIYDDLGQKQWWRYATKFGEHCLDWKDEEGCSETAMKAAGFNDDDKQTVIKCMNNSFGGGSPNYAISENIKLQKEMSAYGDSGIQYWPSLTINHVPYKGEMTPGIKVVEAICAKFNPDKPDFCLELTAANISDSDDASTHYLAIFFILLGLVVVLLLMLYFYKRMMRREMTKEMSIQISQMVSQYFALNEGKAIKGSDNL
jgi:hypothetical protein